MGIACSPALCPHSSQSVEKICHWVAFNGTKGKKSHKTLWYLQSPNFHLGRKRPTLRAIRTCVFVPPKNHIKAFKFPTLSQKSENSRLSAGQREPSIGSESVTGSRDLKWTTPLSRHLSLELSHRKWELFSAGGNILVPIACTTRRVFSMAIINHFLLCVTLLFHRAKTRNAFLGVFFWLPFLVVPGKTWCVIIYGFWLDNNCDIYGVLVVLIGSLIRGMQRGGDLHR